MYNNIKINNDSQEEDDKKLEKDFYEINKKTGKIICIVGRKDSGKSYLATNYLAISYKYGIYDEYHLVLPEYETDASGETYSFIEGHRNTTVYSSYSNDITEKVKINSKNKKILYLLDDATSLLFENKNNPEIIKLVSTSRHGRGITVIIICHALKSILTPLIRGLIDFLFIGAFTNKTLIKKHLFEENFSMMLSEDEFIEEYKEKIINGKYNFMYINGKCQYSFSVNEWNLSTFDRKQSIRHDGKVNYIKIDKTHNIKNKIIQKNVVKKLENKYIWKPEKEKNVKGLTINFKKHKK